jgi:hypothetical protein
VGRGHPVGSPAPDGSNDVNHLLAALLIVCVGAILLILAIVWRSPPADYQPDPRYSKCGHCGTLTVWNWRIRAWVHCDDRGAATTCKTPHIRS